jgi:large subunit ribosomal protein L4
LALKSSLNAKAKDNNLIVIDQIRVEKPKTKEALKIFSNLKCNPDKKGKQFITLLLLEQIDKDLKKSLRNISFINFNLAVDTCASEVMRSRKLIITKEALDKLVNRLKK